MSESAGKTRLPGAHGRTLKAIERWGRRLLGHLVARLLGRRARPVQLPEAPRILVLRFDTRLGNVILLTPLLQSLRGRYPASQIDVLGDARSAALMATHPAVDAFLGYNKAALWRAQGPLGSWWRLRRRAYDLCVDASNPTDPSVTHALVARLCGAKAAVGSQCSSFARLYTAAADVAAAGPHEIDLRLALLAPLGQMQLVRQTSLGTLWVPSQAPVVAFVQQQLPKPYAIVNLGARLARKRLAAADYALIAYQLMACGVRPILSWGPDEAPLAQKVWTLMPDARIAPATNVAELALMMRQALCVISCDTGPMHLAVALKRPTCGLFVASSMARFGYGQAPHICLDVAVEPVEAWMPRVRAFVEKIAASAAGVSPAPKPLLPSAAPRPQAALLRAAVEAAVSD